MRLGPASIPLPWPILLPPVPGAGDPWIDPGGFARSAQEDLLRLADPLPFPRPAFTTLPPSAAPTGPPASQEPVESAPALAGIARSTGLGIRVVGRTELGGDWSRFRPCEQRFRESCSPTLVPRLEPDLRFGIQLGGTISDRIQVDVDYDQIREFEAANTINVRYLGGENAIVRGLEVGDVTFRLPASRFLTRGLPAGNFGFQAEGQLGPVDLSDDSDRLVVAA